MRVLWAALAMAVAATFGCATHAADKADLKVLYAGNLDSPRAKDFLSFLGKHFIQVKPVELEKLQDADAKGQDVVLIDWTSIYPRDKDGKIARDNQGASMKMPPAVKLSRNFDRPTILIGAAGGQFSQGRELKINWL